MSQLKGGKLKRVSLAPRKKEAVEAQAIKFFNDSKTNVNFTLEQIKESFFQRRKTQRDVGSLCQFNLHGFCRSANGSRRRRI